MTKTDVVAFTIASGFMGLSMTLAGTFMQPGQVGVIPVVGITFPVLGYFAAKLDEIRTEYTDDESDGVTGSYLPEEVESR